MLSGEWQVSRDHDRKTNKFTALFDFASSMEDELSFQKGEMLDVKDLDDDGWWYARSFSTGLEGYIPNNFVAPAETIDTKEWYFGGIGRINAQKKLLQPGLQQGTFIVRKSERNTEMLALSVLDISDSGNKVNHCKIQKLPDGHGFYINRQEPFPTLDDLVKYYQQAFHGRCTRITYPCPEMPMTTEGLYQDEWEITRMSLTMENTIAVGEFGELCKGTWKRTVQVAIKIPKVGVDPSGILAEANIMKKLRHPNICQLYGVCSVQWMCKGSLRNYLQTGEGRNLKLPELLNFGSQIAFGMAYLESMDCIHCQLSAQNVLVGDANTIKIADFRLATLTAELGEPGGIAVMTQIRWTAREVLTHRHFSIKSDVWSFGILLTELVTHGQTPYSGMNNEEVTSKVTEGYHMPRMTDCPDALYELMLKCWGKDPSSRPTFEFLRSGLDKYFDAEPVYEARVNNYRMCHKHFPPLL